MAAEFIDYLSEKVYSPENTERARGYLKRRGLDMARFRYPWTITGPDQTPFRIFDSDLFGKRYPAYIFTESLYIPITDLMEPTRLVGFDVRYVGVDDRRLRFHKFKRSDSDIMFYYTKPVLEVGPEEPLLVTEGAIDAESIREAGYPVLSPLTAYSSLRFLLFLFTVSSRIYFMYDNDSTGKKALENVMAGAEAGDVVRNSFHAVNYTGKDPNQTLCTLGRDYLHFMVKNSVGGIL